LYDAWPEYCAEPVIVAVGQALSPRFPEK